ncbi:hypothetical protein NUSPORA_01478 [Nucleospora cyclopteri]
MTLIKNLITITFILSPAIGFIPQIKNNFIIYKPCLSLLTIFVAILKIFDYMYENYSAVILIQNVFTILLHIYLIKNNKNAKRDNNNIQRNHLPDSLLKITMFVVFMNFISLIKMQFMYNPGALILDVATTYFQYLIYKTDPDRPWDLLVVWICGDFIKLYFNLFVYKSRYFYALAIFVQMVFDILTVTSASKVNVGLDYLNM